ncbi:MAG: hypothetical protein ACR65R_16000 [Methylomicrobium sp.]
MINPIPYIERLLNSRALERELSIEKDKVKSLSAEIDDLRKKIQAFEEIHSNSFEYDVNAGIWFGCRDGLAYCAKCKAHERLSPLKNDDSGWICPACGTRP